MAPTRRSAARSANAGHATNVCIVLLPTRAPTVARQPSCLSHGPVAGSAGYHTPRPPLEAELGALELEVLQGWCSDLTQDEIMYELALSRGVYKQLVCRVYTKLGVKTRYGAIAQAFRKGLL